MKITIDKGTRTPFIFNYTEENSIIAISDLHQKFILNASLLKDDYINEEVLTCCLKVGNELFNPTSLKPIFKTTKERNLFIQNLSVYSDLMILYWMFKHVDLPIRPNYVSYGLHTCKGTEYKETNNIIACESNLIVNHWLFKDFKKQ